MEHSKGIRILACHRIRTSELPELSPKDVLSVLQSDFNEQQDTSNSISQEDLQFLELMDKNISCEAGRVLMPLSFKKEDTTLPDNRHMSVQRLCLPPEENGEG